MRNLDSKLTQAQSGCIAEVASAENFSCAHSPNIFAYHHSSEFVAATSMKLTAAGQASRALSSNLKPEISSLLVSLAQEAAVPPSGASAEHIHPLPSIKTPFRFYFQRELPPAHPSQSDDAGERFSVPFLFLIS
jgi:hypothetical protein